MRAVEIERHPPAPAELPEQNDTLFYLVKQYKLSHMILRRCCPCGN